ncbi:hypothetical protein RhiirA4_492206 [Rhizophagus irregularis]|uniref:Uncharacterized protein n=1 Tax=Rhizophagus irregularis TaxID=588596 RepID=A0A2I1HWY4_9GLOM|nr:hypothetical protein RhiirA4_492206 [Rhizophagus irregularis]
MQLNIYSDLFYDPITTSDERIWITSTSSATSSPLYSTFIASNPSQNICDNGHFPTISRNRVTMDSTLFLPNINYHNNRHPLNLKWVLTFK